MDVQKRFGLIVQDNVLTDEYGDNPSPLPLSLEEFDSLVTGIESCYDCSLTEEEVQDLMKIVCFR